ncbi:MAG: hypothetical protein AAF744_05490 [Pseudomonadota bacterium]
MTPLFWISLTWVLAATAVGRMPVEKRFVPGAALMVAALPIILSIWLQVSWLFAILALVAVASTFPVLARMVMARYRGEKVELSPKLLRLMVVPGEL